MVSAGRDIKRLGKSESPGVAENWEQTAGFSKSLPQFCTFTKATTLMGQHRNGGGELIVYCDDQPRDIQGLKS